MGLADSTRGNYVSAQRAFFTFCESRRVPLPLPASESLLCLYIADISHRLSYASARQHLYAIRALHIDLGLSNPLLNTPRLDKLMKGLRREHGDSRRVKYPVTTAVLRTLKPLLVLSHSFDRMLWAAMRLATCGLLRTGEIAPDSTASRRLLTRADLTVEHLRQPSSMRVVRLRLRESKTDQFRRSTSVTVSDQETVSAIASYLHYCRRAPPDSPLFMLPDGSPLTRSILLASTRDLLAKARINVAAYAGISFRRGGATSLARSGAPTAVIQAMGRWKSNAYKLYIASNDSASIAAGLRMSQ